MLLKFPSEKIQTKTMRKKIDEMQNTLEDYYEQIEEMEELIATAEEEYNYLLADFAAKIGRNKLTILDLEYATNLNEIMENEDE